MPDDKEVTEQAKDIINDEVSRNETDGEKAFDDAFKSLASTVADKIKDVVGDTKTPETPNEDTKTNPKDKPEDDKGKPGPEIEDDDADKRGKELLEAEEKAKKEAEEAEAAEAAKKEASKDVKEDEKPSQITPERAKVYAGIVKDWPDTVEVDGEQVEVKELVQDFPGLLVIVGRIIEETTRNMLNNKILMSGRTAEEINDRMDAIAWEAELYRAVPDVKELMNHKEFETWAKNAPEETKALFRSGMVDDTAKGFDKFRSTLKRKPGEAEKKRKEEHDALFTETVERKGSPKLPSATELNFQSAEEEFSSAFKEFSKARP